MLVFGDAETGKLPGFLSPLCELLGGDVIFVGDGVKQHGAEHCCSFTGVEEGERCPSSRFLLGRIVRKRDVGEDCIPGPVFNIRVPAEHVGDGFVEPFRQTVRLRMVRTGFSLRRAAECMYFLQTFRGKCGSTVLNNNFGSPMSENYPFEEKLCHFKRGVFGRAFVSAYLVK